MLGEVLLNEGLPIYEYQNTELTVNDQTWLGGIAGLRNLERRRNEDMPTSNRLLFHQHQLGLVDPRPNYGNPKNAATRVMRYSALLVECMLSGPLYPLSEPLYSLAPNVL